MGWQSRRIDPDAVETLFSEVESLGLITGEASDGLVDVDLDHPIAWRLRHLFLPETAMRTGRAGNAESHFWYRVTDAVPGYQKYTLPSGETAVELRSGGGHQTLIPPSKWYPKKGQAGGTEQYRWEGEPWGGDAGPTAIKGKVLAVRVASLALAAILIENWPREGSRHDAYLALAGGMLRFGDESAHPFWSQVIDQFIRAIAEATHDKDGASARISEVVPTTIAKLKVGGKVQGWPKLAEIIGDEHVARARKRVEEIERLVGWQEHMDLPSTGQPLLPDDGGGEDDYGIPTSGVVTGEDGPREADANPLDARNHTWEAVNMEPYLAGEVVVPEPTILRRSDGKGIFYPGRVNSLYGKSESAKSWVAMYGCLQEMSIGERVVYVDLEDDPAMTLHRLRTLGGSDDDIRYQFAYVRPEGPHAHMQRDTWGNEKQTDVGKANKAAFDKLCAAFNPGLIVVDGMSVLYGLHGLNTNDVTSTDVITNWLKALCRNGRTTVVVIDHTSKGAEKGSGPIGSQHKISMVQGSAIQVVPITQPKPGALGHVELVVGKDRPGKVREISNDDKAAVVADVFIDSTVEGRTVMTIDPPNPDGRVVAESDEAERRLSKVDQVASHLLQAFKDHVGVKLSKGDLETLIVYNGLSQSTWKRAIDSLVFDGLIVAEGEGKGRRYFMPMPD